MLKNLKKVHFCRLYQFLCRNAVPSLSPRTNLCPSVKLCNILYIKYLQEYKQALKKYFASESSNAESFDALYFNYSLYLQSATFTLGIADTTFTKPFMSVCFSIKPSFYTIHSLRAILTMSKSRQTDISLAAWAETNARSNHYICFIEHLVKKIPGR